MRRLSPDCSTIFAFWRGRGKRINTEGTEAGTPLETQGKQRTQRAAKISTSSSAVANRFARSSARALRKGGSGRASAAREPYPFFALSTLAPLLALLSYQLLIGPHVAAHKQAALWSALFAAFVVLCAAAAWLARAGTGQPIAAEAEQSETGGAPTLRDQLLWLCLSACSPLLLLSIPHQFFE